MYIAVDASRSARPLQTGTERYSRELLRALPPVAGAHRFAFYYDRAPLEPTSALNVRERVVPFPRLWTHARLSFELLKSRPDVLFVPAHVLPAVRPCRSVVTIHDLGYLRYRLAYPIPAWIYLFASTRWSARVATRIIADSEATRQDLIRHCGVAPGRVDVVHLGIGEAFRPASRHEVDAARDAFGLPDRYVLFVGSLQPRKNLPRLIRAYARLDPRTTPPLVVAGAAGYATERLIGLLERSRVADRVRLIGYAPSALLPALYTGARAFVFPSLYEGFGLPVLEAMACGTPVIAGANSSMPEIAGDAALLVDAGHEASIGTALEQVLDDRSLSDRLREAGLARARTFTWERAARGTLDVLERAMANVP